MQARLKDKKVGYKKEFLKEILKEVRIKGTEVTLTYRLPLSGEEGKVFTLSNLVEAGPALSHLE
jgi:hypothetical protein